MASQVVSRISFAAGFRLAALILILLSVAGLTACGGNKRKAAPSVSAETYRGPTWLRGTVGSMATLRDGEPMLVSGYTLVVNLDGTGSSEVPSFIRGFLLNEMRKREVPRPEQVLFDTNTAVVAVEGLIPAGASKGDRFDILVTAIDRQTLSLEGGDAWTVDAVPGPLDPSLAYKRPAARIGGSIFVDPSLEETREAEVDPRRQAMIVAGGVVSEDRSLELLLNQPSWQRSRLIADRINERFPKTPEDRFETARAMTDALIRIRVPTYWRGQAGTFLDQLMVLYTQRVPGFEQAKTVELAERLLRYPADEKVIISAWRAMGRGIIPTLRQLYTHENNTVRLASLEAGAGLNDGMAARLLTEAIPEASYEQKIQIARSFSTLNSNLQAGIGLSQLMRDEEPRVRIAAYEAMVLSGDPAIDRIPVFGDKQVKMVVDRVRAPDPMIYVTYDRFPRIVYFGAPIDFPPDRLAQAWNGRLMIRTQADQYMSVFYQPHAGDSVQNEIIPNITELTCLLGHKSTIQRPQPGLDLSYGQTVDAIYELTQSSKINIEFRLRESSLSRELERRRLETQQPARPITSSQVSQNDLSETGVDNQAGERR